VTSTNNDEQGMMKVSPGRRTVHHSALDIPCSSLLLICGSRDRAYSTPRGWGYASGGKAAAGEGRGIGLKPW